MDGRYVPFFLVAVTIVGAFVVGLIVFVARIVSAVKGGSGHAEQHTGEAESEEAW